MPHFTMKTIAPTPRPTRVVTDDEIRDYAYHLYQQSGCLPGHDLDNWLEAKACLEAHIPPARSHTRLHRQRHHPEEEPVEVIVFASITPELDEELPPVSAVVLEDVVRLEPPVRPPR